MSDLPDDVVRCTRCGTQFSGQASPMGLCPACLLKLGLSDPSWTPAAPGTAPTDEPAGQPARERVEKPAEAPRAFAPAIRTMRRTWPLRVAALLAALLALALITAAWSRMVQRAGTPPQAPVIRFSLVLPDETGFVDGAQVAVSPDSRHLVVAARGPGGEQLWLRNLASTSWRALEGTSGATSPFWSPDSRQVAFFADRRLRRIDVSTGLIFTILDAAHARGGSWGSDGFIVFASDDSRTLVRVRATGGPLEMVTRLEGGQTEHAWPFVLPESGRVLFTAQGHGSPEPDGSGTVLLSRETGAAELLVPGGGSAAYARGFLLFVRGSALLAQRFDPRRGELSANPQIVRGAEQVHQPLGGGPAYSVSSDVLVYRAGRPPVADLAWIDASGRMIDAGLPTGDYRQASLSPDGTRIAVTRFDRRDERSNVWIVDLRLGTTVRLTDGPTVDTSPIWAPDGSRIAFVSLRDGAAGVYLTSASGGGKTERILELPQPAELTHWSTDRRVILYSTRSMKTGWDIWALPLAEKAQPIPVVETPFDQSQARLSPDGRWLAFTSNESGRDEVYVRSFPADEGRWQVSPGGGSQPRWRGDGAELHFISREGFLMAADIGRGHPLQLGAPRPVFELGGTSDYFEFGEGRSSRILISAPRLESGDRQLEVVLNWAAELER